MTPVLSEADLTFVEGLYTVDDDGFTTFRCSPEDALSWIHLLVVSLREARRPPVGPPRPTVDLPGWLADGLRTARADHAFQDRLAERMQRDLAVLSRLDEDPASFIHTQAADRKADWERLQTALAANPHNNDFDSTYQRAYWEIQWVLDGAFGCKETDGSGEGIASDVALLVEQRDEAITGVAVLNAQMQGLLLHRVQLEAEMAEVRGRHADIESCISWGVDSVQTARFLSAVRHEEERAEQAEETVERLQGLLDARDPIEPQ